MLKKVVFSVLTVVVGLSFGINDAQAQDPEFTQFYANPLYLNPAFAGTARCPRLTMNFRDQWPGIAGTFVTYSAGYDQHVDALQGGIGVLVMNDRQGQGTINTTSASLMYAYQLNVTRTFSIKAGFQGTFFQKSLDWSKLTFGDMIDERYGFIYETEETQPDRTTTYAADFSAGAIGYSKKYYFGAAVHHLTQPNESLISGNSKLPRKYTVHGGAVIPFKPRKPEEGTISPNLIFQYQQNFMQLNLGLYVTKGPIVGGLWYRNQDSFIILLGIHTDMVRIGYSYDITSNRLTNSFKTGTAGSHEVSFAVQFDCRPKRRKFRTISCPSF
jgi:type IX secretion system PorP/SprF family membrane protein